MIRFLIVLVFFFSFRAATPISASASQETCPEANDNSYIQNYLTSENADELLGILIKNLTSDDINLQIDSATELSALVNTDSYLINKLRITATLEDYLPDIMNTDDATSCRYCILYNLSNFIINRIPDNFTIATNLYEVSNIIHTLSEIEEGREMLSNISKPLFDTIFKEKLNERTRRKIFYCLYDIIPALDEEKRAEVVFSIIDNLDSLESPCEYWPYIDFIADTFPYLLDGDIEKAISMITQKSEAYTPDIITKTDLLYKIMPYISEEEKIELLKEAEEFIVPDNAFSFGMVANTILTIIPSLENNEIKTAWIKKLQSFKENFIEDNDYLTVLNMLIKDSAIPLEEKIIFQDALLEVASINQADLEKRAIAANILYTIAELNRDPELKDRVSKNMGLDDRANLIYIEYGVPIFNADRELEEGELDIIKGLLDELPFCLTRGLSGVILKANGPPGLLGSASHTGIIYVYGERLGENALRSFRDTFYHEIAHTIDTGVLTQEEWLNFKILSGQSYTRFDFTDPYGMYNASEDFSTTFSNYMLDDYETMIYAREISNYYSSTLLEKLEFIATLFIATDTRK